MKTRLLIITFFCAHIVIAQQFFGKAIYKTHRKVDVKIDSANSTVNADMQKQLNEMLKKQFQKTFTLEFTKDESMYKQEEQLSAPQPQQNGVMVQVVGMGGGTDVYYKNLKSNSYINKTEIMGKRFLIKDALEKRDWQLTGETKNIGNYTCYKAVATKEEETTHISMVNGERKESTKIDTITTTAWYTSQIPISNGPRDFGGLPGLILEVKEGKLTIVCSEIVLNPKDKIAIKAPEKGKEVTQKEYDKIMQKKSKEMMERYRNNNRGKKDGNTIEINVRG